MNRRLLQLLALMAALMLFAAACSGGEEGDDTEVDATEEDAGAAEDEEAADEPTDEEEAAPEGTEEEAASTGGGEGTLSVYICEPESLIPQNTNETCGSEVLHAIYSPLVTYDSETNEAQWGEDSPRAMAADITSDDNQVWTITLKEGWTFHDGEPVTAQSFADAWNFGALSTNAQGNSYFFGPDVLNIEGFEDLQGETDDEGNIVSEPAAEEMSGLNVVDDTTLEVTLGAPFSGFPTVLGYTAFYPAHPSLLEDPESFNEQPIGNGPYMLNGPWEHDVAISTTRFEDYGGEPAQNGGVEFQIYAEINTAYNDLLAGNLDIMDSVPPEQLGSVADQFGDRFIERPSSSFTYIGFPTYDPAFENPDLRKAFSMAIDRPAIISAIFNDTFTPADAMVTPVVDGYREGACAEACTYDPEAAAQLFEEAGGYDGTLTLWFNSGAGHEEWMEAVANQLRQNLGIEDIQFESLQFADYLGRLDNQEITGPFRLGWVMDFPLPVNYLAPIHGTGGSSNNTGYSNPEVDSLIQEGLAAESTEEAIELWNQAEDLIIEDMPIIPMWFGLVQGAHSENVDNVTIDAFTHIGLADVSVSS
ncbi:ABC transporter substrate-binding protein [Euzebya sp.]|uniref:peptide ABC transporter substrate-binding protein n=1 Tax=Euzebya sp. TaxID=1971409 RepID=UPI0035144617